MACLPTGRGHPPCMYTYIMATITIYVSRELHEQLKTHRLPVSEICQRALWTELRAGGRKQIIRPTRTKRPAAIQEAQ